MHGFMSMVKQGRDSDHLATETQQFTLIKERMYLLFIFNLLNLTFVIG